MQDRDELMSDVLLWTLTHGRAKAGRPAQTYIQQRCEDTGCSLEDLPEAMNDRGKWLPARHDDDDDDMYEKTLYRFKFSRESKLATVVETPTARPPASYHKNYSS